MFFNANDLDYIFFVLMRSKKVLNLQRFHMYTRVHVQIEKWTHFQFNMHVCHENWLK